MPIETLKILMVEDEVAEAELLLRHLKRAGLQTEISRVETANDFRRELREHPPRLILSDFSLPRFSGMEALEIAVELAPDIPFIFVSGTIGEERAIEAMRRGATDYVLKTNLARLVPVIQRALREADARHNQRFMEKMLQDIVATSQEWIWQLDAEGRFTFCSPAVTKILGYEPSELLGKHYEFLLPPEDRLGAADRLPGGEQLEHVLSGAVRRWQHRSGRIRWLERNAIAILGSRDELIGYRGSDRDVTLRREQETRIRRLSRTHRMLSSANSAIVRISNRTKLLDEACRIAREQGGYEQALITLVVPATRMLSPAASAGVAPEVLTSVGIPLDDAASSQASAAAEVIRSGEPFVCNDLLRETRPIMYREMLLSNGVRALIMLPLLVDGTAVGTFMLASSDTDIFDAGELNVLRELAGNISFALQYFQKENEVEFLSYFDPATGLAKRPLFCERLARLFNVAESTDTSVSIVVFDVQRLSLINDTYGRHVADGLLQQIASRMKQSSADQDLLAHFGGGTFAAAFCSSNADTSGTSRVSFAEASRYFHDAFEVDGYEIRPSIRSGVACFPNDGRTADTLVQNAEYALKHARESGDRHTVYGFLDRPGGVDRVRFETRLTGALEREEFVLHYQPKINTASGQVEAVEALLRWQDPEAGLIAPNLFVPLLESTGAIVEVGLWVLQQAARDCQSWLRAGLPPIRVAVNVSPVQLRRDDFVRRAVAVSQPWATESAGIDIEITESLLMHDFQSSTRKLQRLREAGMRIAIDDFGTGYSSLRRLATLPVDTLKIDRTFVQGITDSRQDLTIVETIIALARTFKMSTVAEGVETEAQARLLSSLFCDQLQGYLYSEAVNAAALPNVIQRINAGARPMQRDDQAELMRARG